MKKSLIIVSLSLLTVFSCIETSTEYASVRRIINETQYEVKIEIFGDEPEFICDIDPFDTLNIEGFCTFGMETYCNLGWHTTVAYGNITFNNDRVQKFVGLPNDKDQKSINADPMGSDFGYSRIKENGVEIYTYRITKEDYENAEPIGG